ncbi:anthrax toxin lethal factor-related metalloendopeptidase [Sediminibacillus albus]|uniref:anthrax toxin lethal factor-related metalloendopeptidase n=1 Tax=Sediminibacillus albus TaxID=407036 RepID=UPI001588243C|nr:toxin [Sediminibacillus albus]
MLKSVKPIAIILLFLFIPFVDITRPFHGMMLQKAQGGDKVSRLQNLENYDVLDQLIVIPQNPSNPDAIVAMVERINQIDRPVLELLASQQVKVRLFEGNLTDEPLLYYLKWQKPRGWEQDISWQDVPGSGGSWLISAKIGASNPGSGHGSFNLELHEIGHTVYRLLMSEQKYARRIKRIWNREAEAVFPGQDYFITYASEYFAEMFSYYYYGSDAANKMFAKAPETYRFFLKLQDLDIHQFEAYYY